ncbi:MAG: DnaJ domain-containing protein [Phycisphaerales bacterium JB039]
MSDRDYYETLGVSRKATAEEIRAAYRKLARRYHPDVSKDADAAAKFAQVQEAYEVLSDPAKRQRYDKWGRAGAAAGGGPESPGRAHYSWSSVGGDTGDFGFDPDDLGSMFDAFFGDQARGASRRAAAGPRRRGQGAPPPLEHEITVTFETAASRGRETLRLSAGGQERTIDVTIPRAVADGARLRIRSAVGDRDLLLRVRVGGHPVFRRERGPDGEWTLDLSLDLPLTIAEATLGARVRVPTLEGPVELTVPPGVAGGRRLRLRGKGLRDAAGKAGDLHATVRIVPPDPGKLTEEQRQARRAAGEATGAVRTGPHWTA